MNKPRNQLWRSSAVAALVALCAGSSAQAGPLPREEVARSAQSERPLPPPLPEGRRADQPLSDEDAALVRELALLEKVELLKNLELFEPSRQPQRRKKGAP